MSKKRKKPYRSPIEAKSPLTFDTLTICFSEKTVSWRGRTVTVEHDCLSIPLTNDADLLIAASQYRYEPLGGYQP